MALLVLVAPAGADLSPLTQHLWAEKIAHRVVEHQGEQMLYLADEADEPRVRALFDAWREGQLIAPAVEPSQPVFFQFLLNALATPLTLAGLLLFIAVFIWMRVSDSWIVWLTMGAEYWPDQRFSIAAYSAIGLWDFWRPTLLHFSLLHLLFNGTWWWVLGRRIEQCDGRLAMLAIILLCGLAGNIAQWWYAGPAFGGASGVTMGMMAWVGLRMKRVPYGLPKALLPVMVAWLLLELTADTMIPGLTSTAHGAHIGGLLAGFAMAALWPAAKQYSTDSERASDDT